MKNVLVTGADRVVGANLAAVLAEQFRVLAVSPNGTQIAGCECSALDVTDPLSVQHFIAEAGADAIIHCSPTAESSWGDRSKNRGGTRTVRNLRTAAQSIDAKLVLVSGDQIYRGPWLFHSEQSDCRTDNPVAREINECEDIVLTSDTGLVLRTHVLGWSPDGSGLLESMLSNLEQGVPFGFAHYATPIAATRFAEIAAQCLTSDLSGVFNVGGAERCHQFGFASTLALHFDLPEPIAADTGNETEATLGSDSIRKSLGISLPTANETVSVLEAEQESRTAAFSVPTLSRAA